MQKGSINGADTYLKSVTDFFFLVWAHRPPSGENAVGFSFKKKSTIFFKSSKN